MTDSPESECELWEEDPTLAEDVIGCGLLGLGTCTNLFSLIFFSTRRKTGPNEVLFIALNTVDLIICLYLVGAVPAIRELEIYYYFYRIYDLFFYLSTFITCQLSAVRALVLHSPFLATSIKRWHIMASIAVFAVMLAAPFLINIDLFYKAENVDTASTVYYAILSFIPVVVGLACSCLIFSALKRSSEQAMTADKRRATITILVITITFLLFVVPYQVLLAVYIVTLNGCSLYAKELAHLVSLFARFGLPLNSTINALIYFTRIKELRLWVFKSWRFVTCRKPEVVFSTTVSTFETVRRDTTTTV